MNLCSLVNETDRSEVRKTLTSTRLGHAYFIYPATARTLKDSNAIFPFDRTESYSPLKEGEFDKGWLLSGRKKNRREFENLLELNVDQRIRRNIFSKIPVTSSITGYMSSFFSGYINYY